MKVRKGQGCVSGILCEIDFQLLTSLTLFYFSLLLTPYSRCLHHNFGFLKNPIFFNFDIIFKNNNKIKNWDFLNIQNYGADIYSKVSTMRKNI